jgi:transcriptional regulator with XRE-family HTH domain
LVIGAGESSVVDDQQVGLALRAIRIRRAWRQEDVARRARVSRERVSQIERGGAGSLPLEQVRRVAAALDGRLDVYVRWHGGDLGRLLNARHAAMHEAMAAHLRELRTWTFEPEVSFSIYGERGVIDILGWHRGERAVLAIELKTAFVDINETMATLDRKARLAATIARERGWDPVSTSVWLVVSDGRTNRRVLAAHANVLRAKYPKDGRTIRGWLSRPIGQVTALSFLPDVGRVPIGRGHRNVRRVAGAEKRAG